MTFISYNIIMKRSCKLMSNDCSLHTILENLLQRTCKYKIYIQNDFICLVIREAAFYLLPSCGKLLPQHVQMCTLLYQMTRLFCNRQRKDAAGGWHIIKNLLRVQSYIQNLKYFIACCIHYKSIEVWLTCLHNIFGCFFLGTCIFL